MIEFRNRRAAPASAPCAASRVDPSVAGLGGAVEAAGITVE